MRAAEKVRALLLLLLGLAAPLAVAAERSIDHATMQKLSTLRQGGALTLNGFPTGPADNASIRFERVQIYAADAHIYVMTAAGKREVPRSNHTFLRGQSDDGGTRIAMSLEPDGSFAEGSGSGRNGSFVLNAKVDASGTHTFSAKTLESTLPSPDAFQFTCGNDKIDLGMHPSTDLAAQLKLATHAAVASPAATTAAASPYRFATIGIDTDSLFMSRLFSNNTSTATNWIASMFNSMNTMYETDLQVQLLVGTTILRTSSASDPYTSLGSGSSNSANLDLFASYWRANESGVSRSFAILLSGAIPSSGGGCSASGIAWIDQYCQKGFLANGGVDTVGSYSVTKVCSTLSVDPNGTFDARIVGHEIGHNFGAYHTHCTNLSTGAAPTGTNTIDTCYNQEGGSGCYTGATSCPAAGSGTIMSYCNFTSVSGCAAGTQNQLHFHPTQINDVLLPDVAVNTPSCLMTDVIFADGFQ
jgi:hypothetical protein